MWLYIITGTPLLQGTAYRKHWEVCCCLKLEYFSASFNKCSVVSCSKIKTYIIQLNSRTTINLNMSAVCTSSSTHSVTTGTVIAVQVLVTMKTSHCCWWCTEIYRVFELAVGQQIAMGELWKVHRCLSNGNKCLLEAKCTAEGGKVVVRAIRFAWYARLLIVNILLTFVNHIPVRFLGMHCNYPSTPRQVNITTAYTKCSVHIQFCTHSASTVQSTVFDTYR